ncbi:putative FBD domain-containing protein [Arabidopsis thaliana]
MHLRYIRYPNKTTLQKLISGSPLLKDLTILRSSNDDKTNVLQVRSRTLKRVYIDESKVVIYAPLLQCLRANVSLPKNFQIINLGSSAKLDIGFYNSHATYNNTIPDILSDISRVRELVISNDIWKYCIRGKKKKEPKVMFSKVPQCLVSSHKFVEWTRALSGYAGEMELLRYFLKNSKILKKFRLHTYSTKKAKCAFLQKVLTMPICSSTCQIHCSFIPKKKYG